MLKYSTNAISGPRFIDLFAGAGGLAEGFTRAGFVPVAHVEADGGAAHTLRTREAFHRLSEEGRIDEYRQYLAGRKKREELYKDAGIDKSSTVINETISTATLPRLFEKIDALSLGIRPDIIIGGPPCQAYSLVGRARSEKKMIGDQRNFLFLYYAEFLKRYRPPVFIFENVLGLLSAKDAQGESYLELMINLFEGIGYTVEWSVVDAQKYGVPQARRRVIITGRLGKRGALFPEPKMMLGAHRLSDVIGDLPALRAGQGVPFSTQLRRAPSPWLRDAGLLAGDGCVSWHQARPHNQRDLQIFSKVVSKWNHDRERLSYPDLPSRLKTHKNQHSFVDRFKVVAGDLPASHTIVAHIAKDGNYYIHPDGTQNRSLTPREAARIQTFPDDYHFESLTGKPSRSAAFKQIGNAVPVVLAERLADHLRDCVL